MIRATIDGASFRQLVRGQTVKFGGVEITLAEIGFDIMKEHIRSAERDAHDEEDASRNPFEGQRRQESGPFKRTPD